MSSHFGYLVVGFTKYQEHPIQEVREMVNQTQQRYLLEQCNPRYQQLACLRFIGVEMSTKKRDEQFDIKVRAFSNHILRSRGRALMDIA